MVAKIKHLAIISDNYVLLSRFYEASVRHENFKITPAGKRRGDRRRLRRHEHHPAEVGTASGTGAFRIGSRGRRKSRRRLREKYPAIQLVKRPTNRPFAGISTHDPEGYVFDLSQQAMTNRAEVYVEGEWKQDRYISHFVLRSLNPANLAKFYREVYELQELEKPADDPNHYLTDGRVTMVISPWAITRLRRRGHRAETHGSSGFQS